LEGELALCVGDLEGFEPSAADGEPFSWGSGEVLGCVDDIPLLPLGGAEPLLVEGEAKEMRPGTVEAGEGSFDAFDAPSEPLSMTAIHVTHVMTVAMASPPANQSLRVPGARDVSGAQPFSQGSWRGGSGVVSGMRSSSSGAQGGGRGCEGEVSER
jgi:hypothetical protein